jgi:hypothetical protein
MNVKLDGISYNSMVRSYSIMYYRYIIENVVMSLPRLAHVSLLPNVLARVNITMTLTVEQFVFQVLPRDLKVLVIFLVKQSQVEYI